MGMFSSNRLYVKEKNGLLYHLLLIGSFVTAVVLLPWLLKLGAKYFPNEVISTILAYLASYLLAMYVVPEILFLFVKWNSKSEAQSR